MQMITVKMTQSHQTETFVRGNHILIFFYQYFSPNLIVSKLNYQDDLTLGHQDERKLTTCRELLWFWWINITKDKMCLDHWFLTMWLMP